MPNDNRPNTESEMQIAEFTEQNLYILEAYTDQTVGTIFRQIPVDFNGDRDPMRQESFGGTCQLNVNGKSVPINFPIPATSLREAIANWSEAVKVTIIAIRDQQFRNKIIMPGATPASRHPHGRG